MSVHTDALTREAADERAKLSTAFHDLEQELRAAADWREYVRREPVLTRWIAARGGTILGAASAPPRKEGRSRVGTALRDARHAVIRSAASAELLKRADGILLDLELDRASSAYRAGDNASRSTAASDRTGRSADASSTH